MARIELSDVLKEGIKIYTTGQFIDEFHKGLNINSLQYAMSKDMVHYYRSSKRSFIVDSPTTRAYQPKIHKGSKREKACLTDEPKVKYHTDGGYIKWEDLFKWEALTKAHFINLYLPKFTNSQITTAIRHGFIDYTMIGRTRLILLTDNTKEYIESL